MSLDELEPVDSLLMFLSGYDTLEYSWVNATAVSVRLRILFVTLQNTNRGHQHLVFDAATNFASAKEAVGAIFKNKTSKRKEDAPTEGSKARPRPPPRSRSGGRKERSRSHRTSVDRGR